MYELKVCAPAEEDVVRLVTKCGHMTNIGATIAGEVD